MRMQGSASRIHSFPTSKGQAQSQRAIANRAFAMLDSNISVLFAHWWVRLGKALRLL